MLFIIIIQSKIKKWNANIIGRKENNIISKIEWKLWKKFGESNLYEWIYEKIYLFNKWSFVLNNNYFIF